MSNSPISDLRDAVTAFLNAGSFTPSLTAVARRRPIADLSLITGLNVTVAAQGDEGTLSSRIAIDNRLTIQVGVQQKVATPEDPLIDTLLGLVKQIESALIRQRISGYACHTWVNKPIFFPEHLDEDNLFTSVITFEFRAEIAQP